MKKAFTLAEFLITLGIISVIAVLTMPSLISEYQKEQTVNQLRKVYSDLNNAIKLSEVYNGPMEDWDYVDGSGYNAVAPFVKKYYQPYFKDSRVLKPDELIPLSKYQMIEGFSPAYLVLNNGVIMDFYTHIGHGYIWIVVDLNGLRGPNKAGRDIFVFDAYKYAEANGQYKIKFWGGSNNYTGNSLYSGSSYSCNKGNTNRFANFYCGRVIELNNWKIPKNYPW